MQHNTSVFAFSVDAGAVGAASANWSRFVEVLKLLLRAGNSKTTGGGRDQGRRRVEALTDVGTTNRRLNGETVSRLPQRRYAKT